MHQIYVKMRQIKPINILDVKVESLELFTFISFTTKTSGTEKSLWLPTKNIKDYFLVNHGHLGINKTNIDDFLLKKDPKYKLTKEHIEEFLNFYLYDNVIIKEQQLNN